MYTKNPIVKPIDAHAHLPSTQKSYPICIAACHPAEWETIEKKNIFARGFGHHPWFVDHEWNLNRLKTILQNHPQAFVGEIGLDRSKRYRGSFSRQRQLCIEQLKIANDLSRPVVFHMVRCSEQSYELIHKYYGPQIYFHGYLGSVEEARRYPHAFFGFHHRMIHHRKAQRLIAALPLKQILVETDNHSQKEDLGIIIHNIAQIKSCSTSQIIQITRENTLRWLGM